MCASCGKSCTGPTPSSRTVFLFRMTRDAFRYSKVRQRAPSEAAAVVSRVMRRVPLPHVQQLLLDASFVFSVANLMQVGGVGGAVEEVGGA